MNRSWPRVNQKQIAAEAGVSQATVSLVLAGQGVTSEVTRQKVLAAAERLRYRPNLLVQGMQTGKTRMVGVMAAPFDSFWAEVLYGIHDALTTADHVPIMVWTVHNSPDPQRKNERGDELLQIHRLLDRRIDAVILWPPFASTFKEHIAEFALRDVPVITIDHQLGADFKADSVGSDEESGGRLVAEYLVGLGHRRIGHLAGQSDASWAVDRRNAFESRIRDTPDATCTTLEADCRVDQQGIDQARQLLTQLQRPTAIFAATDPIARSVYHAAAELGLRVPDDLSVVGFADDDFAIDLNPTLTTVRQAGYDIGRKAGDLALGRSTGSITEPENLQFYLPVELMIRKSVRAL